MGVCVNEMSHLVKVSIDSAAQTFVGQKLLSFGEKILTIIDDCLQWSLPTPPKSDEKNGEPFLKPELKRPLPWILFLPTLLFLRFIRFCVNIGAYILGLGPLEPAQLIRAIRSIRKHLNVSRIKALKENRKSKGANDGEKDSNRKFIEASKGLANSLRLTLSTLACLERPPKGSSPPPTEIRVTNVLDDISLEENPKTTVDKKRKSEELESSSDEEQGETILSQIDRLAEVPSEEDSDYTPSDEETEEANDNEEDEDKDKDEGENSLDEDIPEDEVADIVNESKEFILTSENKRFSKIQSIQLNNKLILEEKGQSDDVNFPSTNGVREELEDAYYSPSSWKSVSPEISLPDKHVDFIEHEKKAAEISNGEAVNSDKVEKDEKDDDSPSSSSTGGETVKDVAGNGHVKDKRHSTSHSGKHHHHQKNKRGNHAGRKKK